MDTPTLACTVYRDDVSSGWEIGNPLTTRFHSTLGFWKFTKRQTVRPEARRSLRHWAVCSPARRSTHFSSTAKAEFSEESALVNLLAEAGTQGVGDLKDSTQHALCQRIQDIQRYRRSSAFIGG